MRKQTVQSGKVDRDETDTRNRQIRHANRNYLWELSKPTVDTITMRRGIASQSPSRKQRYVKSEIQILDSREKQNVATLLAIHSPQLIPEHPQRT